MLSAATPGVLPTLATSGPYSDYGIEFNAPIFIGTETSPRVSGIVFQDMDDDGLQDPNEYSLKDVVVYADVNGNKQLDSDEISYLTGSSGTFNLLGLPEGEYDVRVMMPDDYKASQPGGDAVSVSIAADRGVSGVTFGLAESGTDVGLTYSDVAIPDKYKTGTRITVPVIVTNHGDTWIKSGDVKLRLWLSEDYAIESDDIGLAVKTMKQQLAPGESVKVNLSVKLPDSLADFESYMIVDTIGNSRQDDINLRDNRAYSDGKITFLASSRPQTIDQQDLTVVMQQWNAATPYGGYVPGVGFVSIQDMDTYLSTWYSGSTSTSSGTTVIFSGGTLNLGGSTIDIDGQLSPPVDTPGEPGSISGTLVRDPYDLLYDNLGWLWNGYEGLEGWTVYLDQNQNNHLDSDEQWTQTGADGKYVFNNLPTYTNDSPSKMTYRVRVVVPNDWLSHHSSSTVITLHDGEDVIDINFGFYSLPHVGPISIDTGHLLIGGSSRISVSDVSDLDGSIRGVAFYCEYHHDSKADNLLGIDTDGSDGYGITYDGTALPVYDSSMSLYAVVVDNDGFMDVSYAYAPVRHAVDLSPGQTLIYKESDGTVVEVTLQGPGTAKVLLSGDDVEVWHFGKTIEVTGEAAIDDIELIGTNGRSKLNIATTGSNRTERIAMIAGDITGNRVLGSLVAPNVNISRIWMPDRGVIKNIKARSIDCIQMANENVRNGVNIQAQKISGYVSVDSPIKLMKVANLISAYINTPSADKILVGRNMYYSSLTLTDSDADFSLNLLDVGNSMTSVRVTSVSSIDTIRADIMSSCRVLAGATIQGQSIESYRVDFPRRAQVRNLAVTGSYLNSYVAAWRLGAVRLDSADQTQSSMFHGLGYQRLGSFQGPKSMAQPLVGSSGEYQPWDDPIIPYEDTFVPFPT